MALIYEYLMADAAAGRVEVHTVFLCKCLNISVFLQVAFTPILNIVIQRHNDLLWIVNSRGANRHELPLHWPGIIVSYIGKAEGRHNLPTEQICHGGCQWHAAALFSRSGFGARAERRKRQHCPAASGMLEHLGNGWE